MSKEPERLWAEDHASDLDCLGQIGADDVCVGCGVDHSETSSGDAMTDTLPLHIVSRVIAGMRCGIIDQASLDVSIWSVVGRSQYVTPARAWMIVHPDTIK